ncbi:hypothetical protein B0H11DRAFT_1924723 [Mycena galericulata]|nr:hypothetical protein B0H11DRAFT_1924723 [Mycena galericulata]
MAGMIGLTADHEVGKPNKCTLRTQEWPMFRLNASAAPINARSDVHGSHSGMPVVPASVPLVSVMGERRGENGGEWFTAALEKGESVSHSSVAEAGQKMGSTEKEVEGRDATLVFRWKTS